MGNDVINTASCFALVVYLILILRLSSMIALFDDTKILKYSMPFKVVVITVISASNQHTSKSNVYLRVSRPQWYILTCFKMERLRPRGRVCGGCALPREGGHAGQELLRKPFLLARGKATFNKQLSLNSI